MQMIALIAMLRRQSRRRLKRRALLKNRVRRPAHAARPVAWRGSRRPDHAAITSHRQPQLAAPRAPRAPPREGVDQLPAAARIICARAPSIIIENVPALADPPPPLPTDDIDHAYGEECASIMREFARRLKGARNPGQRRAIKSARKSALAAAKQKAKRAKAARQAANAAQRHCRAPP
jgi:hypothetical protein